MGSPLRIPQSLIAFFASLVVGVLLVSWLSTFLAFSKGSPDFPVAMLMVTFSILMFNSGFVLVTVSVVCILQSLLQSHEGRVSSHRYHVFGGGFKALGACFNSDNFPARVGPRGDGADFSVVSLDSSVDDESESTHREAAITSNDSVNLDFASANDLDCLLGDICESKGFADDYY